MNENLSVHDKTEGKKIDKIYTSNLKPCPFCGSSVALWNLGFGVVRVIECAHCGVRFVFKWSEDNVELSKHWNRRD